jgi:hypothetical protein
MPVLRNLEIFECKINNAGALALVESPLFDGLRSLQLTVSFNEKLLKAIAASGSAKTLRRLAVRADTLTSRMLAILAKSFPNLTTLSCHWINPKTRWEINTKDLARFFSELSCPNLRVLELSLSVTDEAVQAIIKNPTLSRLRTLQAQSYGTKKLTDKGFEALLTSNALPELNQVLLDGRRLDRAVPVLLNPAVRPNLRYLSVRVDKKLYAKLAAKRPLLRVFPEDA